jgi:DNA polymerase-3 subunit delta'
MLFGHSAIRAYLTTILSRPIRNHAYLFYGPEHIGKTTVAFCFAQALVCTAQDKRPCEMCQHCRLFMKGNYPDLMHLSPSSREENIGIAEILRLKEMVSRTAFYKSYKLVIIEKAEKMTPPAATALLKTLEEPKRGTVFILTTNARALLPETVLSRTEAIKFHPIDETTIYHALGATSFDDTQKRFIARFVEGRIGIALTLTAEEIRRIVKTEAQLVSLLKAPVYKRLMESEKLAKDPSADVIPVVMSLVRDLLLIKIGCGSHGTHTYLHSELERLAQLFPIEKIVGLLQYLNKADMLFARNINKQLVWNNLLLKMASS